MAFNKDQPAYTALRGIVAERTKPLLAWTGSGLSAAAGLPTWPQLKEMLLDALLAKADSLDRTGAASLRSSADAIKSEPNYWVAFHRLQKDLGQASYRDVIRAALAPADTATVPQSYLDLWQLRIRGVLNLNLDRLATRSLSGIEVGTALAEFDGHEVARVRPVISGQKPFIVNLHGRAEITSSWVFTRPALNKLLDDEAYISFIDLCLSTHTVLFLGLTADDLAVGGHLERLARLGIETDSHFWLTNRRDFNTDKWAEAAGIRVIRYRSIDGDHSEAGEFFTDLRSYVPEEPADAPPPVAPSEDLVDEVPDGQLPTPEELAKMEAEEIRSILNRHAARLLKAGDDAAYDAYDAFCEEYDEAIYRAWYARTRPGANKLLGYTLNREAARGAFGTVFAADDPDGNPVAVKLLHEEIHGDRDLLRSFRRGVRSMRILQERAISGMAAYHQASEIPAFVVMDWINGPNLTEAVRAHQLAEWEDLLRVGANLADIIRRAHALPERVLHRDIRPSNVMLEGFYADPQDWTVTVLDFDLSWHKGAFEQSVLHTTAVGYLAPEQIRPVRGVSTRNAAVDSFGVGMTLFFLCSGQDPLPDQHRHRDWEEIVVRACDAFGTSAWRSLPARFARLILATTDDNQSARWDMTDIAHELERLRGALHDPESVTASELLAEELAAHTEVLRAYEWDANTLTASRSLPTGIRIELVTELQEERILLRINWNSTGVEERTGLGKYVLAGARGTADQLRAAQWDDISSDVGAHSIYITATIRAEQAAGHLSDVATSIDRATRKLVF
jgi:serine/threonine protein kinase